MASEGEHAYKPGIPVVVDEAGDSSLWLPFAGIALVVFATLWFLFGASTSNDEEVAEPEQSTSQNAEAAAEPSGN